MNTLRLVFTIVCGVTFIFLGASTGGPNWIEYENSLVESSGIFRYCHKNILSGDSECKNYDADSGDNTIKATRAFAVLAVLTTIGGTIVALIGIFSDKVNPVIGSVLMIIAGLCALIAACIYTDDTRKSVSDSDNLKYGWSFALQWVGMITAFVAAALGFAAKN